MDRVLLRLRGWIEASHPFPLAAVVLLTGVVGITSSESFDSGRLALVLAAMLCSQLAIGWTNDYADRESDRLHQRGKPIPSGRVDAAQMPFAIALALAGAIGAGVVLGPLPLLFLIIGTLAGLSYDLWLRQSRWSWLCYVAGFVVLPPFVWSALDVYRGELLVGYAIALPLAPAAHIANVLPDRLSDAASGRRNLTVIWGRRLSLRILAASFLAPILLTVASLAFIDYNQTVLAGTLLAYGSLLLGVAAAYQRGQDSVAFRFAAVASVVLVGGWLTAV